MENLMKGTYLGERYSFFGKTHLGQHFAALKSVGIVSKKEKMTSKKQPRTRPKFDGC